MPKDRFDVELTQGAEDDLEAIFDYLADNVSIEAATDLLDGLLKKVESLEGFPIRGNVPKELESVGIREFRQVLMNHYRLIYRVIADKVFVMVIADGRRDMQALLERRLLGRGT
jgi:toxin ParE1/3/4